MSDPSARIGMYQLKSKKLNTRCQTPLIELDTNKTKGKMSDYTTYTVNFSGVTFITATSLEQAHSQMEAELSQVASSWEIEITE